ncbi:lipoprotein-releasing ABC transporter ATP-binding protein LolD [Pseudidiomarina marina]|uniref:Lipoprotein-releasing system ATP-binding protein LolD n=1 Tax=Pseudidiomarina marina TaxID=502366 RepID=A0A432YIX5_9GAMM|nr:lipoprotein-releasing ABC transporter ATP-binding protein LolD [Pseudidiomarina marina]PHR65856.1 MAG: lipoprotein-releasing system ATP-binding protein LolD [Idiomarina sp.]RUO60927.1 lipoprotein-releasing system ATP-binding protein LolD [Pseudidiomarina marina]
MHSMLMECRQLSRSYQDGDRELQVLKDVNLTVHAGEMLAIVGSSGSGKSTLLHCMGGLDKPTSGDVLFAGYAIQDWSANQLADWRNKELGFIYQFHHLLPEFTALENVAMPQLIAGVTTSAAKARAERLLRRVGLAERLQHRPAELSGGERQRVAIARALANSPRLVLADEPTGNLDDSTAEQVFELLLELNEEFDTAFVIVTHDNALAAKLPRTLTLHHGQLAQAES